MNIAALLCLAASASAAVISEAGQHAVEETLNKNTTDIFQNGNEEPKAMKPPLKLSSEESDDSSSSKERLDHIKIKDSSESSESEESSSSSSEKSDEDSERRKLHKRSLESNQESFNAIGKSSNHTIEKLHNILEKNTTSIVEFPNSTIVIQYSTDKTPSEPSTSETDTSTEVSTNPTTELIADITTEVTELETVTEPEDETTELQSQTTTERQSQTTIETQPETNSETDETVTEKESKTVIKPDDNTESETKSETTSELIPETVTETTSDKKPDKTVESSTEKSLKTTSGTVIQTSDEEPKTTTENEIYTTTQEDSSEKPSSSCEDDSDDVPMSVSSTPSSEVTSIKPEENQEKDYFDMAMDRVNKLSDQIRLVLVHYRKIGVVVVPGQSFFPDPMEMQDFRQSFSIGTIDFKNMRCYGLSNFTVEHINTDVDRMQVYILLHMKRLVILGNYTLRTFFSRAAGPFNVTLLDVDSEGVAEIQTAAEGHLEATDSVMDMFTKDMRVDFKNLGFMGSMFQGMVSAVGDALFNSIKPQILERVNLVIRTDVNKKLKELSTKFINKVNPVDLAFSEGRRYCRTHGYDPYHMQDHTFLLGGLVYVNVTQFWVEGLSKFYRVGNLSLSMDSGVIEIGVHVMTGKLTGQCHWSGQTFGIVKYGKTNFTVDHLQVRAMVHQSLDVRKKPILEDLDLELGWVKVTMDSPMTLNLMIEGIINAFPRLIRHIIVDTLEQPLKEKIQEILDQINVESIVDENLPRLDDFGL